MLEINGININEEDYEIIWNETLGRYAWQRKQNQKIKIEINKEDLVKLREVSYKIL